MVDEPKITLKVRLDSIFQMISNKVTSWSQTPSNDKYPSEKLVKNSLDGKVDKVTGKGLSTNDFTGYYKGMIDGLSEVAKTGSYSDLTNKPNYTPTITSSTTGAYKIGSINVSGSNVDIYGKDTDTVYTHPTYSNVAKSTSAIYKFKTNSLGHIIEISTVSASDLPSHNHDDRYYTESEVNTALNGKANSTHTHKKSQITDFPSIPSKTSDLQNDSGFLTTHQSLSNYYNKSETNNYDVDFILGTQTASTSAWTGTTDVISSLREGTTIFYKLPYASTSTNVTLNLTLKGGGTTGAKNVFYKNTSRVTTHFGVGQVVGLTYDGTAWYVISPSDNNSNNDNNYGGIQFKAGEALTTQTICCAKNNGQYYKVANGVVLDIRYPLIMTSSAVASGTTTNTMYRTWYGVNIANTKSMTLTNGSQLFLEGTAYSDGKFTISSNVVTHTLTNGRYYIKVGTALSTTQIRFISDMTVYYYNGTTLKPVIKKEQIVDFPTIPDVSGKEDKSNKVTSISSSSTDTQYPSAKCVYNQLNNKAPTSHASSSTTYGVATSSNYGHTKVINNLTTSVASNGQALNAYQGKVLNDNKIDKNDFNVDYVYSFVYNTSIEKYAYQGQSGAVGIGVSAIDTNDNSLLNENGVAIIDLVFQNTNINYGSIQLVLAEADGVRYTNSSDLLNTQTIATISDTNEHHITVVVSSDTHIKEQGYDYYDLKVLKISYDGSDITVSSGKTSMERVGVYLVFNGAIGGNIEYMNVIKRTPIVNQIIDIIYPIGSTYISVNSVNPSFLFGGEWEQIQDRFLLASGSTYSAGSTGGSATVSLSASQMPRHNHSTNSHYHNANTRGEYFVTSEANGANNTRVTYSSSGNRYVDGMNDNKTPFHHRATTDSQAPSTNYTGGTGSTEAYSNGSAHENMPPYLTVYMWKRVA